MSGILLPMWVTDADLVSGILVLSMWVTDADSMFGFLLLPVGVSKGGFTFFLVSYI